MSVNYKYVSIDRIFSKVIRDLGGSDIVEGDIIEWVGEALEFIGAVKSYEEAVAFVEVKNHQCDLPSGLHAVIQIARNNSWRGPKDDLFCPRTILDTCTIKTPEQNTYDQAAIPVALDCNGEPINAYDLAYYRPFFNLKYDYYNWRNSGMYRSNYSPVRLSTNTFFSTLVCETEDDNPHNGSGLVDTSGNEYTIIRGELARFSFREGSVAIAYLRQVTDPETGYPLIPDNISYTTAITKYITLRMMERQFYAGRDGSKSKVDKAEADWHWYCKQAGNVDMMPNGIDEHQNLLDQRSYLLPQQNRYYGFFGKMARPEQRKWNDPDGRNGRVQYFIGN